MSDIKAAPKKVNGKKKLMFIPILLIALVLVFVAYKMVFADSAKLVFFTALDNEIKKAASQEQDDKDSVISELMEDLSQRSNVSDTKITGNINITNNGVEISELSQITDIIGDLSLNIHNESDADSKTNYTEIFLNSNDDSLFDLMYYLDDEKHILGSSLLGEKLLSVKLADMDVVLEKLGLGSNTPDEAITLDEIKGALDLDSEEYKSNMAEYKDFIIEYFDKEEFMKIRNINNGFRKKC